MELGKTTEEVTIYEGLRILARIIAQAIINEVSVKEESLRRRDLNSSRLVNTNDTINDQQKRLVMSVSEVAKLFGLSRSATYQAVHSGQIPSIRVGSRILIPRVALSRFLNEVANGKEHKV
jgi:excisionase family DNA binding protein